MTADNKLAIETQEFWDEEALLAEERRAFDVCHGCRLCWNFCPSFPALFEVTDAVEGDMGQVSRAQLRPVEDLCYQCKLCYVRCPYTPPHRFDLDVPRLLMRAKLVNTRREGVKLQDRIMGDTDLLGKVGGMTAPMANWGNSFKPLRLVIERVMGVHRDASLPRFHMRSFSSWFKGHGEALNRRAPADARGVVLFYTCFVNYNDPAVGIACAQVLSQNNLRVTVPRQQCCGMPFLDGGDLKSALRKIRANLRSLAETVRQGYDIVVPGPTCSYTLKQEYPRLVPGDEASLVSEHTFDISEYLWKLRVDGTLNTQFGNTRFGDKVRKIAYHAPCHTRAQFMGNKGADLLALIPGVEVEQIERCSGHDGAWGIKKDSHPISLQIGGRLFENLGEAGADLYVTDCPLASMQIEHATGRRPLHPMQVLKEAYGI